MTEYTQTTFGLQGNCWQTVIACVLDVDPTTLPDQSVCDQRGPDGQRKEPYFGNLLNAYLRTHHRSTYATISPSSLWDVLGPRTTDALYFMSGPTVRTGTPGGAPSHVVIARGAQMIWDPHPSRDGLLRVEHRSILVPYPPEWDESPSWNPCRCPACAADGNASP